MTIYCPTCNRRNHETKPCAGCEILSPLRARLWHRASLAECDATATMGARSLFRLWIARSAFNHASGWPTYEASARAMARMYMAGGSR